MQTQRKDFLTQNPSATSWERDKFVDLNANPSLFGQYPRVPREEDYSSSTNKTNTKGLGVVSKQQKQMAPVQNSPNVINKAQNQWDLLTKKNTETEGPKVMSYEEYKRLQQSSGVNTYVYSNTGSLAGDKKQSLNSKENPFYDSNRVPQRGDMERQVQPPAALGLNMGNPGHKRNNSSKNIPMSHQNKEFDIYDFKDNGGHYKNQVLDSYNKNPSNKINAPREPPLQKYNTNNMYGPSGYYSSQAASHQLEGHNFYGSSSNNNNYNYGGARPPENYNGRQGDNYGRPADYYGKPVEGAYNKPNEIYGGYQDRNANFNHTNSRRDNGFGNQVRRNEDERSNYFNEDSRRLPAQGYNGGNLNYSFNPGKMTGRPANSPNRTNLTMHTTQNSKHFNFYKQILFKKIFFEKGPTRTKHSKRHQ